MNRRKPIAIAVGISAVLILSLREAEVVYWNYYKSSLNGSCTSNWSSDITQFVSGTPRSPIINTLNVSPKTPDRVNARFARALSELLQAQHINGTVTVDFQKWSLNGLYWPPLYKNGQLEYSVSVDADLQRGLHQAKVQGTVSGKVDSTVSGLCSLAEFNAILLRDIASNITEQLTTHLEKPIDRPAPVPPAP